jgi:mannose-1-phosphate guanylyltransferase/mannose-6-phosphate isomerase
VALVANRLFQTVLVPHGKRQLVSASRPAPGWFGAQDGIEVAAPLIVSGKEHRFWVSEQLREAGIVLGAALLEPVGRNTAPALTLDATENGQDQVLVVTPADQTEANTAAFTAAVQQAIA